MSMEIKLVLKPWTLVCVCEAIAGRWFPVAVQWLEGGGLVGWMYFNKP